MFEAFLSSVTLVAISEIGDKTQLLALVLAARFRRPWPICLGILVATVFNHAAAGWVGQLLASWLRPEWLQWGLAASLFAMAGWMLIPDKIDENELPKENSHHSIFWTTCVAFFIAELGDKTQIATVLLAAKYAVVDLGLVSVVLGTTAGMLLANVPVVWFGGKLAQKIPLRLVHMLSAGLFVVLGVATLLSDSQHFAT